MEAKDHRLTMMSMDNSLPLSEAVLNANLSGIAQMKQRNYSRSIVTFRNGLRAIQDSARQMIALTTEIKNTDTKDSSEDSMNVLQVSALGFRGVEFAAPQHYVRPIQSTIPILDENTMNGNDNHFLLFDRALMVSVEYMYLIEHSAVVRDLASAVLIYNMGLAYHLEGLRTGMSQKLLQAVRFYNISYCLLCAEEKNASIAALVMMAIVNNTGHLHAAFCNYYETSICSHDLLTYYHDPNHVLMTYLSEEESAIFIKNCTCFLEWQNVAAPAA